MERGIPKQGMHVAAYSSITDGFMGFGTIVKPSLHIRIGFKGEIRRGTTPVMKLVRHGKVRVVNGVECYWTEKDIGTTLGSLRS